MVIEDFPEVDEYDKGNISDATGRIDIQWRAVLCQTTLWNKQKIKMTQNTTKHNKHKMQNKLNHKIQNITNHN